MEKGSAKFIGTVIKKFRKQNGMTQFDLAEAFNINEKQIAKIECEYIIRVV